MHARRHAYNLLVFRERELHLGYHTHTTCLSLGNVYSTWINFQHHPCMATPLLP